MSLGRVMFGRGRVKSSTGKADSSRQAGNVNIRELLDFDRAKREDLDHIP